MFNSFLLSKFVHSIYEKNRSKSYQKWFKLRESVVNNQRLDYDSDINSFALKLTLTICLNLILAN